MQSVNIRTAEHQDLFCVIDYLQNQYASLAPGEKSFWYNLRTIMDRYSNGDLLILVKSNQETHRCYGYATVTDHEIELLEIYKDYRNMGYGREFVRLLEDYLIRVWKRNVNLVLKNKTNQLEEEGEEREGNKKSKINLTLMLTLRVYSLEKSRGFWYKNGYKSHIVDNKSGKLIKKVPCLYQISKAMSKYLTTHQDMISRFETIQ